jgi:hypothetical protein
MVSKLLLGQAGEPARGAQHAAIYSTIVMSEL